MTKGTKSDRAFDKLKAVVAQLNNVFAERRALINGALVSVLTREHFLMLGPPGTAKTDFAMALAGTLSGSCFEAQLMKDTSPEEILGPFSAKKMIDEDKYERAVEGYAPEHEFWFLDEIFKSSSALLQAFLLAMSHRKMRNGARLLDLPLQCVIAASNEYPEDSSLDALYDRFCMKFWVDYIADDDSLLRFFEHGPGLVTEYISTQELEELRTLVDDMPWGQTQAQVLLAIKHACEDAGFKASDRTWIGKAPKIVKAMAVLNGHKNVQSSDYLILADILWKHHNERDELRRVIGNASDPYGARVENIIDTIKIAMRGLPSMDLLKSGAKTKVTMVKELSEISGQVAGRLDAARDVVDELAKTGEQHDTAQEALTTAEAALKTIDALAREVTFYREPKNV